MDWWMSTKSPRHMLRPQYRTQALAEYLRSNVGVDSAILAVDCGLHPSQIEAYQRELGLRTITGYQPKGTKT